MPTRVRPFRAAALAIAACLGLGVSAHAATVNFSATIDGAQETTCASPTTAQGAATATLNDLSGAFNWNITFGTNSPTFDNGSLSNGAEILAHFHGPAGPGSTAGVKVTLPLGSPKVGSTTVGSAGDRTDLKNGLWYINIHSAGCGGGEIRGQVLRVPSCGDGFVDGPGEECDDGNNTSGDGCTATCEDEPGPAVPALSTIGATLLVLLLMAMAALVLRRRAGHGA